MKKKKKEEVKETLRESLVRAIIELAGDELESSESLIELAEDSDEDLVHRLINIALYYKDNS